MENNEKPVIKSSLGKELGTVSDNKEKIDKIIKNQSTGLPKAPIEDRIKDAIEQPKKYSVKELEDLYDEWILHLEKQKTLVRENKLKVKLLSSLEKEINKKSTDLFDEIGTNFKILAVKIKNLFIKKE